MDVFVINLDRSADRWTDLSTRANAAGFQPVRFPAIDGQTLPQAEIARLNSLQTGTRPLLGAGEIGCFLSHRALWQRLLDRPADWMLVLEDDVHFHNLAPLLADSSWLPADADFVKCETLRRKVRLGPLRGGAAGIRLARLQSQHLGTGGYFLSRRGAENLLGQSQTLCEAVDQFMFNEDIAGPRRFTIYQTIPALVVQDIHLSGARKRNFASTLDADRLLRPSKSLPTLAKLWRESKRLVDLRPLFAPLICRLTSKDRIRRVPFGGDHSG